MAGGAQGRTCRAPARGEAYRREIAGSLELVAEQLYCRLLGRWVATVHYERARGPQGVAISGFRCCRHPGCARLPEEVRRRCRFLARGGGARLDPLVHLPRP